MDADSDELAVPEIFEHMKATFLERSKQYKNNWKMMAGIMTVLFPDGIPPHLFNKHQFYLFVMVLAKMTRYAVSNLEHIDSIHDAAVYAAMCEAINQHPSLKTGVGATDEPPASNFQVRLPWEMKT